MTDEGHVAGTKSDAMRLAISLGIERRWIVSGSKFRKSCRSSSPDQTPSTRWRTSSTEGPRKRCQDGLGRLVQKRFGRCAKNRCDDWRIPRCPAFSIRIKLQSKNHQLVAGKGRTQVWLGQTIEISHGRTHSQTRVSPLLLYLSSDQSPNVIDMEASLPPSTVTTEVLQFHPMQRITYNVLAALIATNVYTSRR